MAFARVERYLSNAKTCQAIKAVVAVAQVEIVGIRLARVLIGRALDCIKALRLRHIQRAQDQPVQNTKNHRICADGHGQRQNGGNGKSWRLAQLPQRVAKILEPAGHLAPPSISKAAPSITFNTMQLAASW